MKEIIETLQTKKALFEELLGSIGNAKALLAEDKIEEFERELDNCERIMRSVDKLGDALKNTKREPAAAEMEKDIERILPEIVQANRELRELSEEKLKGFGKQIKALRQKKTGLDAYNKTANKAVFIDAKK